MATDYPRGPEPDVQTSKEEAFGIEERDAGYFKPTSTVREAWEVTRSLCATALKAQTILFQCPASFTQTKENISNLEKFFSSIDRGKFNFCWEPRGDWDGDLIKSICSDLKLWHVVDPSLARTVTPRKCYFRLHGRTGWKYEYEETELRELAAMMPKHQSSYVFFNNVRMTADALRFQEIIKEGDQ